MKIAIVTGASAGIGREFAVQLDDKGLDELWLVARRMERLEELAGQLSTKVRPLCIDLRDEAAVASIGAFLEEEEAEVVYLVNNAGFGKLGDFAEIPSKDQLDNVDVNVRAVTQLSHICIPYMPRGSQMLHVSSIAGFAPLGGFAVYAATKAYVTSFSLGLLAELRGRGIHSIAVCPGPLDTEFGLHCHTHSPRKKRMFTKKALPDGMVRKALRDAARRRAYSVYGFVANLVTFVSWLLPKRMVAELAYRVVYRK